MLLTAVARRQLALRPPFPRYPFLASALPTYPRPRALVARAPRALSRVEPLLGRADACTTNRASNVGLPRTGADDTRAFIFSKSSCCVSPHSYRRSFLVRAVRGSAVVAKSFKNLRYQEAIPMKRRSCFMFFGTVKFIIG